MSAKNPSQNVTQILLVFITILHSIGVIMTCLRLWFRLRLRRLWWEDAWAFVALCLDVICAVSTWTLSLPLCDGHWYMSRESHIVSMWLKVLSYTSSIWAARMSIMFSLIRMVPPLCRMRSITSGFAVFFFFLWALCVASKAYTCGSNRSWYNLVHVECPLGLPIAVTEVTTDVISDLILVSLPTRILYGMKLPRNERILILSIFSMSLLTVIVSVIHVAFLIPSQGFISGITADIEGSVDLINCNLLVLVTSAYRFFRNGEDIESMENNLGIQWKSRETASMTPTLTTIDLERFGTVSIHSTQSAPVPQPEEIPIHTMSSRSCFNVSIERV